MSAFDHSRFLKFLRFELATRRSEYLLSLAVPPILYSIWAIGCMMRHEPVVGWGEFSYLIGLFLGLDIAAAAHRRETDPGTAAFYLMLPASHVERFLSRLLISIIPPFVIQFVILTVLQLLFTRTVDVDWNPLGKTVGSFVMWSAVFFAGGVFFRGKVVVKTALAATFYYGMIAMGFGALILMGIIRENQKLLSFLFEEQSANPGLYIAWNVAFPLLLYAAAFLRARENEVRG